MVDLKTGTRYRIEPQVLASISERLSEAIKYQSLSMQSMPVEQSLPIGNKIYEYYDIDHDIGVGFEMDVSVDVDGSEDIGTNLVKTPVAYTNYSMGYDDFLNLPESRYTLQQRLLDRSNKVARRIDLINYLGDTKHGISSLESVATEITTPLNFTTTALLSSTLATALKQMRSAGKYAGLVTPMSNVVVEVTPDYYAILQGLKSVNEDFNGIDVINNMLRQTFGAGSRIQENYILGGSYSVDGNGKATITEGTTTLVMYPQNPQVTKIVQSGMVTRQSNLDETKGITFQPLRRNTRVDDTNGTVVILKESAATTS